MQKSNRAMLIKYQIIIFYSIIMTAVIFIFISNPFLKIPYDMWEHLNRIVGLHDNSVCYEFFPENTAFMCFWHSIWATIFKMTQIDDVFIWAKIIHVFQYLLAFSAIFYFCRTAVKILLRDIDNIHLLYISLIGVLLWFIGNGTFSNAYHQAWIMWYSVTYQGLAIPLFWYITALMLKTAYEDLSFKRIVFYFLQIAILSVLIAKIHPMEFLYFVINILVLFFVSIRRSFELLKKYYYIVVPFTLSVVMAISYFAKELIPSYILPTSKDNLSIISQNIFNAGSRVVDGKLNRFPTSFSEVAVLSLILAAGLRIYFLYKKERPTFLNAKAFDYILASSFLFFIIPLNKVTAGISSYLLTLPDIVWRFVFGSPWFVLLPVGIYISFRYVLGKTSFARMIIANSAIVLILILLSKLIFWGALYKNTESILFSLDKNRVGVQYSEKDIAALKEIIMKNEPAPGVKPNMYYIRGDFGPIVKGVFRKFVYMYDRRTPLPAKKTFFDGGLDAKYTLVDVTLPENFPKDSEIFRYFPIDKR